MFKCLTGGGKWPNSGCYYSDMGRWSIAYRTVDAQYWGTPQRRKRIALLADFNGLSAPDILFDAQYRGETEETESDETLGSAGELRGQKVPAVSAGLPRDSEPCGTPGEGTAAGTESGAGSTGEKRSPNMMVFDARGNGTGTISPTLTGDHQNRITDYTAIGVEISRSEKAQNGEKAI